VGLIDPALSMLAKPGSQGTYTLTGKAIHNASVSLAAGKDATLTGGMGLNTFSFGVNGTEAGSTHGSTIKAGGAGSTNVVEASFSKTSLSGGSFEMKLKDDALTVVENGKTTVSAKLDGFSATDLAMLSTDNGSVIDASAWHGQSTLRNSGGAATLLGSIGRTVYEVDTSGLSAANTVTITPVAGRAANLPHDELHLRGVTDLTNWSSLVEVNGPVDVQLDFGDSASFSRQTLRAAGLNIAIKASHINLQGVTIDTSSTGQAGSISLSGTHITLDAGTQLLATGGTSDTPLNGDITIEALDDIYAFTTGFARVNETSTSVTIDQATVTGGEVSITATAKGERFFDGSSLKDTFLGSYFVKGADAALDALDSLSVLAAVSYTNARATVHIGKDAVITADSLVVPCRLRPSLLPRALPWASISPMR
jgi:hypothetical protein